MGGQIILGILGIVIGGGGLIAFVVGLIRPHRISVEELAAFEERKRNEKKCIGGAKLKFNYCITTPFIGNFYK